jgi:APA family basic amino acid/polyamine antiporter
MGFALGIFPIMTVFSVMKLRKKNPDGVRLPGYPVTQIIYISTGLLILVLAYLERPMESSIATLTVIAGIPAYYIFRKVNGQSDIQK